MIEDYASHLVEEVRAGRLTRRELIRRGSAFGLSLTALGTLLAACGRESAGGAAETVTVGDDGGTAAGPVTRDAPKGGSIRVPALMPAAPVEPLTANDAGTVGTYQNSLEYLCFPAPDLRLQPRLATGWRPGASVREWTFTLRDDVLWHDGRPLTADDVVASFDRYTDPDGEASARSSFTGILDQGEIEKLDDRTVRFHLARPYADFPYLVSAMNYATPILPRDYEPGAFRAGGVGTGAYVLRTFSQQRGATFVRNERYWGGFPNLDGLEVRYFDTAASIVRAMREGELEVVPGLGFSNAELLRDVSGLTFHETPSSSYRPVHLRVDTPPFDDRRVRQAFGLALDREAIIRDLLGGKGDVGNDHAFAPIFPISPQQDDVPQRTRDVERARALLAEAGHGDGLAVTLTTLRYEEIPRLAQILREQLAAAGVELTVKILPQADYFSSGGREPWLEVPMGIVYWASRGSPTQLIAPAYLSEGIWNSAHWRNEEFDRLVAALDAEADVGKRKGLAVEAAALMQEETPALIPYWQRELRVVRDGVVGVAPGPNVVWDPAPVGVTTI